MRVADALLVMVMKMKKIDEKNGVKAVLIETSNYSLFDAEEILVFYLIMMYLCLILFTLGNSFTAHPWIYARYRRSVLIGSCQQEDTQVHFTLHF